MNENKMNINWLTCIYDVLACNMPTHFIPIEEVNYEL